MGEQHGFHSRALRMHADRCSTECGKFACQTSEGACVVAQDQWDGRPQESKRATYYWLKPDSFAAEAVPVCWQPGPQTWRVGPAQDDNLTPEQLVTEGYGYYGECLTGAETAQLRAALA